MYETMGSRNSRDLPKERRNENQVGKDVAADRADIRDRAHVRVLCVCERRLDHVRNQRLDQALSGAGRIGSGPNIAVTMHKGAKLSGRAGTETTVTGGNVNIHMKTEKPVTCAALKSAGEAVTETNAIFKWNPKGQGNWMVTFTVPLTESPVSLGGKIATGSFPFSEDTISGSVTQKYTGTCGTGGGHGKGKKVNKG
ncbi:MAG TPA: hypothetical protein VGX51_13980, partial [Solirubrobacteraceae bacterium]|nr:hypothetical protein [Solirubrobacteraceae bacterium]